MKVVTADQMRTIEGRAAKLGFTVPMLMENAGLAVAREARHWIGVVERRPVLILVGPGNNGGDGLVAARHLHDWRAAVRVYIFARRTEDDPNLDQLVARNVPWTLHTNDEGLAQLKSALSQADVVIDALLGTGKARTIEGPLASILGALRCERETRPNLKLVALDLPTGLDADTGAVDPACVPAGLTVTLGYPKTGLLTFPGAGCLGELVVADIGIPPGQDTDVLVEMMTALSVKSSLPARPLNAHKGSFGKALVVAGSLNFVGAAYLATMATLRVGAGLATLATPERVYPLVAGRLAEATYLPLPEAGPGVIAGDAVALVREEIPRYNVLLIGCGLGQRPATVWFVQRLLSTPLTLPMVVDADGLNALTKLAGWWKMLPHEAILTPHTGEMARLTGTEADEVSARRLELARDKAREWDKIVVLKGAHTVVASPDGRAAISPWANPGLATGGTGDVLAGAIAGLLAQGMRPFDAACSGVYLHGLAGEMVRQEMGEAGMLASDLLPLLPRAIMKVKTV
ncbi:MAG: NAD(P)H-hydrate dehydratase [Dehalococcoidia bacterium]|nr:NAD(P)H-hydrate dehydratase [Dehalococcoidia bacterium]